MPELTKLDATTPAQPERPIAIWRPAFLAALGCNGNVSEAAKLAGISRQYAYVAYNERPDFAADWDTALEIAADVLEREAWRRAVEGGRQYKFTKDGDPICHPDTGEPYFEMVYSDALLTLLLKAHRREKFGDQSRIDLNQTTAPAKYDLSRLTEQQLAQLELLTALALVPDAADPR
ncbi:hypothetical protein [Hymenobacter lapidiphilus]|uniref:Uncharacterized protein n=1 Tax=Hymenobacter lapidiphilus TaxID=2608003 RepID=A0A7Y7PSL7_9BACT|nr:hypothetical protein [Hymenobacter lapidiphilus]NVO33261.1 hypothetical protein [Hymenobacter lapidiphilus]